MLPLAPFKLERYFARYEFNARYLLSASDCEGLSLTELLTLADADSLGLWHNLTLGYTESAGHPALRAEIARLYPSLTAEDVLVLTPEEGIFIAMSTLLRPGDEVIAIAPAYQSLAEIARSIGCTVRPWRVELEGEHWRLDLDALARSFTPQTRLLIINFPHNPTGYLPTRETFDAIFDLARQHEVFVFSDEMYRWLELDPARRLPAVCEAYENGITLCGLSKSFALPGLRMGWLATRLPGWIDRWLAFKDYTTICHNAPSEILALMALRAKETILVRSLDIVRANLRQAEAFFGDYPALFRWIAPQGGSIAFPGWRGPGRIEDVSQRIVEEQGVMMVPASMFEHDSQLHEVSQHFRVGLGRKNFPEALAHFQDYLRSAHLI
jgi:aspartate/methionine/tyrosine aminotransferase